MPGKVYYEGLCMKAVNQSIGMHNAIASSCHLIIQYDTLGFILWLVFHRMFHVFRSRHSAQRRLRRHLTSRHTLRGA